MENTETKTAPTDFNSLGILPELIKNLETQKIQVPTQIQCEAVPKILESKDLIAVAQTGSGKTLAYLLPVLTRLQQNPLSRAVVLSPTRETAEQIFRVFKEISTGLKITASVAATGTPVALQGKELKKNPRLIVATPGRLHEHLQGNKLLLKGLDMLVIDEADRILTLGFEKQLQFIQSTLRGERQTLLFAATFSAETEPIAKIFMKPDAVMMRSSASGAPVATLQQKIFFMKAGQKENKLIDVLQKTKGGVIIFCDNQEGCVALGRLLANHAFSSEFVHGDMNPGHRNRVLREFREQKIQIIVTTDLLARGLDEPSIQYVISYDLPYKSEDYLHRIGRTARAGREGKAITFVTPTDGRTFRRMKDYLTNAKEETITDNFKFIDR
jgi:ATP-dependent RNA helicase RhlE